MVQLLPRLSGRPHAGGSIEVVGSSRRRGSPRRPCVRDPRLSGTVHAPARVEKRFSKALLPTSSSPSGRDKDPYVTDPRALRALAHPTRVAILDHLYLHGPATATQCAAAVHESPSSCSFHLRTLARWGFVEELPAKGRHRPWRPVSRTIRGPLDLPERGGAAAPIAVLREYLQRDERLLEEY